jgi:hypothetical protein
MRTSREDDEEALEDHEEDVFIGRRKRKATKTTATTPSKSRGKG